MRGEKEWEEEKRWVEKLWVWDLYREMEMHGVDDTSISTSCKERKERKIWERESGVGEKEHVGPRHIGVLKKGKTRWGPHVVPGQIRVCLGVRTVFIGDNDGCRRKQPISEGNGTGGRRPKLWLCFSFLFSFLHIFLFNFSIFILTTKSHPNHFTLINLIIFQSNHFQIYLLYS